MSIAEIAKVTPIAPSVRNRILILDVERLPGITQQMWWDRGDLQKRYIHHETVTREPRTTNRVFQVVRPARRHPPG